MPCPICCCDWSSAFGPGRCSRRCSRWCRSRNCAECGRCGRWRPCRARRSGRRPGSVATHPGRLAVCAAASSRAYQQVRESDGYVLTGSGRPLRTGADRQYAVGDGTDPDRRKRAARAHPAGHELPHRLTVAVLARGPAAGRGSSRWWPARVLLPSPGRGSVRLGPRPRHGRRRRRRQAERGGEAGAVGAGAGQR